MKNAGGFGAGGISPPTFSVLLRCIFLLPLLTVAVLFTAFGLIGIIRLAAPEWAALLGEFGTAASTALICLVLAVPAASRRPSVLWVAPLAVTAPSAAGWSLLPLPAGSSMNSFEGAVLLLPVMVLMLGAWWRRIPANLAEIAASAGASPTRVLVHAVIRPALPGVAGGIAVVFTLAVGLAPLLAPAPGKP